MPNDPAMFFERIDALQNELARLQRESDSRLTRLQNDVESSRDDIKSLQQLMTQYDWQNQEVVHKAEQMVQRASDAAKSIEGRVKNIEILYTEVQKACSIAVRDAVVSDHAENALRESRSAAIWRSISVFSIVASAVIAILLVFTTDFSDVSPYRFAAKAGVALPVAALATYSSRQSSEHRHAQRDREKTALLLSAARTHVETVSDPQAQDELATSLMNHVFLGASSRTITEPAKQT